MAQMRIVLLAWICLFGAGGCTTPGSNGVDLYPAQKALIGKTRQQVLACAGQPIRERTAEGAVLVVYYKEASQLEESFPVSKSSYAKVHHGCYATLMLQDDRVTGVQYESEPSSYQDEDHCEEIFQPCIGQ
jgi:hypothetical protein